MHGRKRAEYKHRFQDERVAKGLQQKAQQWYALSAKAMELRRHHNSAGVGRDDDEMMAATEVPQASAASTAAASTAAAKNATNTRTLELLDKMLRVNPDPLHLWNQRREILATTDDDDDDDDDGDPWSSSWLPTELALTAAALERNPKAYGAWFHRKWSLQQYALQKRLQTATATTAAAATTTTTVVDPLLQQELQLTELFLQRDERNFHCWNFRRFLVGLELQLTKASSSNHVDDISNTPCGGSIGTGTWSTISGSSSSSGSGVSSNDSPSDETIIMIGPQIASTTKVVGKGINNNNNNNNSSSSTTSTATNDDKYKEILQREWQFTQTKIIDNFSNFSAFHYRTKLLGFVPNETQNDCGKATAPTATSWNPIDTVNSNNNNNDDDNNNNSTHNTILQTIAQQEWSLMENIMFTEPDDQTIWWYHRFILDWVQQRLHSNDVDDTTTNNNNNNNNNWYKTWLLQQAETLQVLVEEANDNADTTDDDDDDDDDAEGRGGCKWALLGYHLVLSHLVVVVDDDNDKDDLYSKMETVLNQLAQIDPNRIQRYRTMLKRQKKQS